MEKLLVSFLILLVLCIAVYLIVNFLYFRKKVKKESEPHLGDDAVPPRRY
jgi:hypothetical protein